MPDPLSYYAQPGLITSPGAYASWFDELPRDVAALCRLIQGVMIHIFWVEQYGIQLSNDRKSEVQLRSVEHKLERIIDLEPYPLSKKRSPDKRLVGNCRDFTVLLTAMLRHQGVPARARCGFATYFIPDHFEDHWVCEVWDSRQERWVLVDAQLDELQRAKLSISFDVLDIPRDQFLVGGRAWQMCRSGQADPNKFGIMDLSGLWFVRENFVRDVAALNKVELLPWDSWGIIERRDEDLSADDLALLEKTAHLTGNEVLQPDQVWALYEGDSRFKVPETIQSYTQNEVLEVNLSEL